MQDIPANGPKLVLYYVDVDALTIEFNLLLDHNNDYNTILVIPYVVISLPIHVGKYVLISILLPCAPDESI